MNLEIYENEVYGIAGESGCGKTTLLKALFGAIEPPLRLIDGSIFYHIDNLAVDITTLDPEERRKLRMQYISYVPQGSMSVLNPVIKLKDTYRDFIGSHADWADRARMPLSWPASISPSWGCLKTSWMPTRTSSPAACASA